MIFELVLRNFNCSLEFVFSLLLLQPFNFSPVSFTCNFQDWGCVILREIDLLLKICWSIPCLHPSRKVHTWTHYIYITYIQISLRMFAPHICECKSSCTPGSWWIAHSTCYPRGCNNGYSNNTKMVIYSTVQSRCYIINIKNTSIGVHRNFSIDRLSRHFRLLTIQCKWAFI